ncbi:MAG TPA: hypothetical protein VGF43_21315 [Dongiaceae bacterium]|jgi:hypothetical protein
MEKVDEPLKKTSSAVYFHLDEVAALLNRLSEHYKVATLYADGYTLKFDEFAELREKLQKDRIDNMSFILLHKDDKPAGSLSFFPRSSRFEVDRSTAYEIGVWNELREFIQRHSQERRWRYVLPPMTLIAFGSLLAGAVLLEKDHHSLAGVFGGAGSVFLVAVYVFNQLLNRTVIYLYTKGDNPRRISRETWITIWSSLITAVIGAVIGSLVTVFADKLWK